MGLGAGFRSDKVLQPVSLTLAKKDFYITESTTRKKPGGEHSHGWGLLSEPCPLRTTTTLGEEGHYQVDLSRMDSQCESQDLPIGKCFCHCLRKTKCVPENCQADRDEKRDP